MLKIIQPLLAFFLILLVVPQTPTENILLRKFLETGLFTSYAEAKTFLTRLTWILILIFLILTYILSVLK